MPVKVQLLIQFQKNFFFWLTLTHSFAFILNILLAKYLLWGFLYEVYLVFYNLYYSIIVLYLYWLSQYIVRVRKHYLKTLYFIGFSLYIYRQLIFNRNFFNAIEKEKNWTPYTYIVWYFPTYILSIFESLFY